MDGFHYSAEKSAHLRNSVFLERVNFAVRNEMEFSKIMKFNEAANKSCLFSSVFCSENCFRTEFQSFSLPKMVQNGIPRFFLFLKCSEAEVWEFFSFDKGSAEFWGFSHPKMVRNGILRVFLFWEMVRNGTPRFFSSAKQAEFLRNCHLFHLVPYSAE